MRHPLGVLDALWSKALVLDSSLERGQAMRRRLLLAATMAALRSTRFALPRSSGSFGVVMGAGLIGGAVGYLGGQALESNSLETH